MKKYIEKDLVPIILIILVAFSLRISWLKDNLFFGWEQGRDFLKMKEILAGDLVLLGPKTDIPGVFHGALSYYIPLIPFSVFGGDPYLVLLTLIGANSIAIYFLYKSVEDLFSKRVAILSTLFYAVSYSSIVYSRWLSNPNLVPALTIFYFYFLVKAKKNWIYLIFAAISWGVMVHLMVVVPLSLVIPTFMYLYYEKIKISMPKAVGIGFVLFATLSTYLVFEARSGFLMVKSLLANQSGEKFWLSSISFIDQFLNEVVDNIFPFSPRISFLVFMAVIIYAIYLAKNLNRIVIVLLFLFSVPILFIFVSDAPLRHFFISTSIFISITVAIVVDVLMKSKKKVVAWTLVSVVVVGNLYTAFARLPETKANFIHHAQRTYLGDMKNLLDYAYIDADGERFTYDYYSVPYWKEDAWIYLFQWYGKGKYGYAPSIDRTNVDRSEIFYTFIEPNETTEVHLNNWYGEYKKDLELLDTYESRKLKVEKRTERSE